MPLSAFTNIINHKLALLKYDDLLDTALQSTGLDNLGDPRSIEAMQQLILSVNTSSDLSIAGQIAFRHYVLDLLQTRLRLIDFWQRTPDIEQQDINSPVFITGTPRSGSTFLHRLLSQDPVNRYPRTWEVMFPLPSPDHNNSVMDVRIKQSEGRLKWIQWLQPEVSKAHPLGAELPQECGPILGYSFQSHVFLDMFLLPSYEKWLSESDMSPAYDFHMRILKHLKLLHPGQRWVLKSSDHLHAISVILKLYPDARIIFLHRDPMKVLQSSASIQALLKKTFCRNIDLHQLAAKEIQILSGKLNKIIGFHDRFADPGNRFIDVRYMDLARDPLATVHDIYARFGFELSIGAESRMSAFTTVAVNNISKDRYSLPEFGIDPAQEYDHFAAYRERFGIAREAF